MSRDELKLEVKRLIADRGALLGKELVDALPQAGFLDLWQACFSDLEIHISHFARYYLRYDKGRDDLVRLSPSILRDFLSFTLFSLAGQREGVIERQVELSNLHREISLYKMRIASTVVSQAFKLLTAEQREQACAFIAGDLTYFLGHSEPREVAAIGELVRGSDIDIVIVHNGLGDDTVAMLDQHMLGAKSYYLNHPDHRQELDFVCKPLERMFAQFGYSDIHEKIASKIFYESLFLGGSLELYEQIKQELERSGAHAAIEADFEYAIAERKRAMRTLLKTDPAQLDKTTETLFYFSQERVEFQ
ncbi:MAG: hypothetical protein AAFQ67_02045 [Pseudomonadota bacterium]